MLHDLGDAVLQNREKLFVLVLRNSYPALLSQSDSDLAIDCMPDAARQAPEWQCGTLYDTMYQCPVLWLLAIAS